ncbi:MAG: nucleoside:proton symporter [Alphaproteobacteria bacterium]|nr:nucleoside:proton symporter [Alphaproteobacteria bacterium]
MEFVLRGLLGLFGFVAIAWLLSENRTGVPWRQQAKLVAVGLTLQFCAAVLLLKFVFFKEVFLILNGAVWALQDATAAGTTFVFGFLGGGELPFETANAGAAYVFAFRALPLVIVMSALSALLFHWRILPLVVRGLAWLLRKSLGVGGPLGVAAGANVFLGMVEAPLLIRPYLGRLGRGELFAVMTCGMATIAGTVMLLFAVIIEPVVPDAIGQLLVASIINVPVAILVSRIMIPDTGPPTGDDVPLGSIDADSRPSSALEAITHGTVDGARLVVNIVAMLIVAVAFVSLTNHLLDFLPYIGETPVTLERVFGWLFAPVAWLMGVGDWAQAQIAGQLLGVKLILNELIAYTKLAALPEDALTDRARLMMTYALCGFANFGGLGIMIGGLITMVPGRRSEIVQLSLKSLIAGTIANCMTGTMIGML